MALTVRDFSDLLRIVNTHPRWRHKMVRALFPEVDAAKAFQDLAEAKRIGETTLARLEKHIERMDRQMKTGFAEAKWEREIGFKEVKAEYRAGFEESDRKREAGFEEADRKREAGFEEADRKREAGFEEIKAEYRAGFEEADRKREAGFEEVKAEYRAGFAEAASERAKLKEEMRTGFAEAKEERAELRRDVAQLKGITHEDFYFKKANAVFGRYLKNGQNATDWVADQLYEAQRTELISSNELTQVLASDLLWRGKLRTTGDEVVLVLEASWFIEAHDIERATKRADVLRRLSINAIPVAAGREWIEAMRQLAKSHCVVMTDNGKVNDESWQLALGA